MKKYFPLLFVISLWLMASCGRKQTAAPAEVATAWPEGVVVDTLPSLMGPGAVLEAIADSYQGQVVLIDFWATWCGPCMAAMKQIDPIKERYLAEDKPVVFVYVTGETSPQADWEKAIPAIKGHHYRLTAEQYEGLLDRLGIRGIPSYMILNKDGSRAYDNIQSGGYPGDEVLIEEINNALAR